MITRVVSGAAMCKILSDQDAMDGANGWQWRDPFGLHFMMDSLCATRLCLIIETESEECDDMDDFSLRKAHGVSLMAGGKVVCFHRRVCHPSSVLTFSTISAVTVRFWSNMA